MGMMEGGGAGFGWMLVGMLFNFLLGLGLLALVVVTPGIYRYLRHPQYLGLILIVLAFNIQWPTLPTLVMAPLLTLAYVGLARREDREQVVRFGEAFRAYAARTQAFLPSR
jgi:protein-S-isoprenylcysteine O-methyltransferase Ste14